MLMVLSSARCQGYGSIKACISRNVRARYVMGVLPCTRSNVFSQIHTEESRLSWSCSELPLRHGSVDVGDEPAEEGK